jgi:hypothetical protein
VPQLPTPPSAARGERDQQAGASIADRDRCRVLDAKHRTIFRRQLLLRTVVCSAKCAYIVIMAKPPAKSWLPKRSAPQGQTNESRSATTGRYVTEPGMGKSPRTTIMDGKSAKSSPAVVYRSSVSGRIELPNGHSITTVRKDVMDRALGRGEFKKK